MLGNVELEGLEVAEQRDGVGIDVRQVPFCGRRPVEVGVDHDLLLRERIWSSRHKSGLSSRNDVTATFIVRLHNYICGCLEVMLFRGHSTCNEDEGDFFMRVMALLLASTLAVCFMDPASAATKRSPAGSSAANPDRSVYPNSRGCTTYCYRSGSQKIRKHKH